MAAETAQKVVDFYKDLTPRTQHFLAGFATTSIIKAIVAPFEVLRFIAQTQPERFTKEALQPFHSRGIFLVGTRDKIRMLIMQEGTFSLWRGLIPNVLKYFPNIWVRTNYKTPLEKALMPPKTGGTSYVSHVGRVYLTGTILALMGHTLSYPLEVLRTRLATDYKAQRTVDAKPKRQYGLGRAAWTILKEEGIQGLYKGFCFSTVSVVPFLALYYGSYDLGKLLYAEQKERVYEDYMISGGAAAVAMTLAYPMDTVRRNMMKSGQPSHNHLRNMADYSSAIHCFRYLKQEYGWRGFYRGFAYNMIRAASVAALVPYFEHEQEKFLKPE